MSLDLTESRQTSKGLGVFAQRDLPKGTLVYSEDRDESERRVYTRDEIAAFCPEQVRRLNFFGVCLGEEQVVIESYLIPWVDMMVENIPYENAPDNGMFFNHSCNPNLVWASDITLVTWKDVAAGDELTYDYGTEDVNVASFRCKCMETQCRGDIGGEEWQSLQHVYGRNFRESVLKKIDASAASDAASN
tara:strand:+ start:188 stop:757 length:570 start_codon:yes stop_codon:yes gene_type:complete